MNICSILFVACALLSPAFAGDGPGPFGIEGGVFKPSGIWAGDYSNTSVSNPPSGYTFGLSTQFKSDSRYQGRLRIGYMETGKAPESQVSYSAKEPLPVGQIMVGRNYWRGMTIGYDWMPHLFDGGQSGPFALLGGHLAYWKKRNSATHPSAIDPSTPTNYSTNSSADVLPALLVTVGFGYRFNPRTTFEGRYIKSSSNASIGDGGKGVLIVATFRL